MWSPKKIKAVPSRKAELSANQSNDVYSQVDYQSRPKRLRRETVAILELRKESKRGINLTLDEVAPHGEEPVENLINHKVF